MPTQQDIEVWRGNDEPIVFAWPDGYEGSVAVELTVWIADTLLFRVMGGGGLLIDADARRYLWYRTLDESRLIPTGSIARYELEDQSNDEVTLFFGAVTGRGGRNLDLNAAQPDGALTFNAPAQSGLQMMGWI